MTLYICSFCGDIAQKECCCEVCGTNYCNFCKQFAQKKCSCCGKNYVSKFGFTPKNEN